MLVYLIARDPAKNRHRHYLVSVQRDLWGNLVVLKYWGRVGAAGWQGQQSIAVTGGEDAERCVRETLQRRRWHGYQIVEEG